VRSAVLADTAAPALLLELLDREHVPSRLVRRMQRYPFGWGTLRVDYALAGPVPWTCEAARSSAVVHLGESVESLDAYAREVRDGRLPDHAYLVVGQQSLIDHTRAPRNQHTLYCYTHVPREVSEPWTSARETMADRIEGWIEDRAPGFRQKILARHIEGPRELEAKNENIVGGDLGGGTNRWTNQLFLRPAFPYFRYRMPVGGVYLCSAATHPGGGVHGMCGYNAALAAARDLGAL
jgi:phytoene dehydrogenase-like protein